MLIDICGHCIALELKCTYTGITGCKCSSPVSSLDISTRFDLIKFSMRSLRSSKLTNANSSKAPKMKAKQTPIQRSIALVYETGGSLALMPDA